MEKVETMTVRALYRGILKGLKTYPSTARDAMRVAFVEDVADWKQLTDEEEVRQAKKKMRMLYGHITMWSIKMEEVNSTETEKVDKPLPFRDMNRKDDKDFIYF